MMIIRLWYIFFVLYKSFLEISASTHWVVTENGRIQSHLESPFYLRRHYDLLALLDQETRRNNINTLYQDLVSRKSMIDQKWSGLEGASDLELRVYSEDKDCQKAGKLLSEIDLYPSIAANGSGRPGVKFDFISSNTKKRKEVLLPDCSKFTNLDFSLSVFEHLPTMRNRANVSFEPEEGLGRILPVASVDHFGQEITIGLSKNGSSWVLYNLASVYWRIKGDAPKAIECARRAIYFSPREYRDIPFLNLALILHKARYSTEAAIILHAAVDHAPIQPTNYFVLGNVYASMGEYNRSLACYDNLLKLMPDMQQAHTAKHAILCHLRLKNELMELHESLQGILSDLHDYHSQQQQWVRHQERMIWEQAPFDVQIASYSAEKLGSLMANRGQRCVQRNSDTSKPIITCDFTDNHVATNLQVDITLNLQQILQNVESETQKITEQITTSKKEELLKKSDSAKRKRGSSPTLKIGTSNDDGLNMPPMLPQKFPVSVSTSGNKYFDVTGWPTKQECRKWNLPIKGRGELDLPVFLPPENKGYQIDKMLSDYIGLSWGSEHELPWYPPICEYPDESDGKPNFPVLLKQAENNALKPNDFLRKHLLKYVNGGKADEAEIGQRIITAMNKKTAPRWVLATLASLYWRVRSDTRKALDCLEAAYRIVPKNQIDVIIISIGSLLHEEQMIDEALKFAMLAFKVNNVEPSTNFLLALLNYEKNNPVLAMHYMKNVLRLDPSYYDGRAEMLLKTWACRMKLGEYKDVRRKDKDGAMCGERQMLHGEGVVCSANGDQCKTATIHCIRADSVGNDPDSVLAALKAGSSVSSFGHCNKFKSSSDHSTISSFLASEGVTEPDQSQLESMVDGKPLQVHLTLDDKNVPHTTINIGDFYVSAPLTDDPTAEVMLHVFDKSGTYSLSPDTCRKMQEMDLVFVSQMWQPFTSRNVDIGTILKAGPKEVKEDLKPYCSYSSSSSSTLDYLTTTILKHRLPNVAETSLAKWLSLMANDRHASLKQLSTKIAFALQENGTSWLLATAAALYWRVVGNTQEAVTCISQALAHVSDEMRDVPLSSLAGILLNIGYREDALEVAYVALDISQDFVFNHFLIANIHASLGDFQKSMSFYRSSLAIDSNFEPARKRLQSILCVVLFDEGGHLRGAPKN